MSFMRIETAYIKPFRKALRDYADTKWKGQKGILAEKAKISGGYLSEIIWGKKIPSEKVADDIAKVAGMDFLGFIQEYIPVEADSATTSFTKEEAQKIAAACYDHLNKAAYNDLERHLANKHQQLLSQFNDKEQAHSINQKLIEIEKVAPDYLAELNDILAVKLNHLQRPKKQPGVK